MLCYLCIHHSTFSSSKERKTPPTTTVHIPVGLEAAAALASKTTLAKTIRLFMMSGLHDWTREPALESCRSTGSSAKKRMTRRGQARITKSSVATIATVAILAGVRTPTNVCAFTSAPPLSFQQRQGGSSGRCLFRKPKDPSEGGSRFISWWRWNKPANEGTTNPIASTDPRLDGRKKYADDEDLDEDDGGSWLQWMRKGQRQRRGVAEVKLREAEELGGVPRSDRYSSRDWLHNTVTMPSSKILKDIASPCIAVTSWAVFLSLLYQRLMQTKPTLAAMLALPSAPHSLTVSALSLLLVFKTNSAYQRFAEGRKIWESIINTSRDLYRLTVLYEDEIGKSKRRRIQRLLAAFPYLLRHRIRPNLINYYRVDDEDHVRDPDNSILLYQDRAANDLDPELAAVAKVEETEGASRRKTRPLYWVDKRLLPWRLLPPDALELCASAQNRPLWVCDRMAQELRKVPDGPHFAARERLTLIAKVEKLSGCIGACERIHQTAVPLNYARHSLRALTLWLFTLPLGLVNSLRLYTGPVLFLISWLMFGIYQIGYSIEDPFQGTLRLSVLCDTIRRDVLADEVVRSTAFVLEPPEDEEEDEKDPVVELDDDEISASHPDVEGTLQDTDTAISDGSNNGAVDVQPAGLFASTGESQTGISSRSKEASKMEPNNLTYSDRTLAGKKP